MDDNSHKVLEQAVEQLLLSWDNSTLLSWDNSTDDFAQKINQLRISLAKYRNENLYSPLLRTSTQHLPTTRS